MILLNIKIYIYKYIYNYYINIFVEHLGLNSKIQKKHRKYTKMCLKFIICYK